ncbi:methyltransferase [Thalassotalea sp. G2M2-11]|uniref:methyltransferase n=1 Tax=Thalassotalea sp. G2M2-11 TaxID=2787627 RepID=UPI0019D15554|nr:methyltransferase [Thalassotalea sp. G2M2-11]
MHLTNLSQLLARNEDLLKAKTPLLINMPDDDAAQLIKQQNPQSQVSYYDTNFELHLAHQAKPNHACIFAAQYQTDITHDLVIITFPKSKNELLFTLSMLADCTTEDTNILLLGENKSGIKSIAKLIKDLCTYCNKVDAARHCLMFEITLSNSQQAFNLDDWYNYYQVELGQTSFKVAALPGVFSQKGLDTGSKVLLEHLPNSITGSLLDFGCGAGVIATFIGLTHPQTELTLADVNALALTSSQKTLAINGLTGKTIATNSLSHIQEKYQFVISNPPFHQGIKTHYLATEQFLAGVYQQLTPQGRLLIVANSFLQYQPIIEQAFGHVNTIVKKQGFSVYQAKRQ